MVLITETYLNSWFIKTLIKREYNGYNGDFLFRYLIKKYHERLPAAPWHKTGNGIAIFNILYYSLKVFRLNKSKLVLTGKVVVLY